MALASDVAGFARLSGKIERFEDGALHGWLWDRQRPTTTVEFELLINGVAVGRYAADRLRGDLKAKAVGTGYHAFRIQVEQAWLTAPVNDVTLTVLPSRQPFPQAFSIAAPDPAKGPYAVGYDRPYDGRRAPAAGTAGAVPEPTAKPREASPRAPVATPVTRPSMLVVSWDMGHNPVGRAYLLADMARRDYDVRLIGPVFPQYGTDLWEPLRNNTEVPVELLSGELFPQFLQTALDVCAAHKPDVVYVSKARLPSLLIGILMKLVHGSRLIVDIDDHELSFFKNNTPIGIDEALKLAAGDPEESRKPYGEVWTRLCETLVAHVDAVTVSNVALQRRFGGLLVRHARDEERFVIDEESRQWVRAEFGLAPTDRVVLFIGTPRPHKGIFRIADALEEIDDPSLVFVVIGSFTDMRTRNAFKKYKKARVLFFDNQPWDRLPSLIRMADMVAILQDPASTIAEYQIPAKLTDALAMGIPVLATKVAPFEDIVMQGALEIVDDDASLVHALSRERFERMADPQARARRRQVFLSEFSYSVNTSRIGMADATARDGATGNADVLAEAVCRIAGHFGVRHPLIEGLRPPAAPAVTRDMPKDVVFFWKQNDSDLYGRRSDMMVKYLLKTGKVRRIMHFDRALNLSELERNLDHGPTAKLHQGNLVYMNTVRRVLRMADDGPLLRRTFLSRDGSVPQRFLGADLPPKSAYVDFIEEELRGAGFDGSALAWVCPVVFDFPKIQDRMRFPYVIADVIDDQRQWQAKPDYMARVAANYADILREANLVVANCEPVKAGFADLRRDIVVVPNGAETFEAGEARPMPWDLAALPRPVIGYVGNLRDRIDVELIETLARANPEASVVLVGSAHDAKDVIGLAERVPNVHLLGVRPYEQALAYISHFDVAIMPHLSNAVSENMNPLKLYVYYALGVPIVTTEVANIHDIGPLVHVAGTHDDFVARVRTVLQGPKSLAQDADKLRSFSWDVRLDTILRHAFGPAE